MSKSSNASATKSRGNLAYQQRQKIRRSYLERKQNLRKIFEMGKVVEKAGFDVEDLDSVYKILIAARKK